MRSVIWGAGVAALGAAAMAQPAGPNHDYQPGDLLTLGGNSYPPNGVYEVMRCDPVGQYNRQCYVQRRTPDREDHDRPLTIENYTDAVIVGKAQPAAPPAAAPAPVPAPAAAPRAPAAAAPARTAQAAAPVGAAPVPAPAAAPRAPAAAAPARTAQAAAPVGGACPRSPNGGSVPGSRAASAALFQQKITDTITGAAYGPFWYGVRLSNFSVGAPIRNTVGQLPGGGASRVNNGAPVNATMYPVSTTMSVCDGAPNGSSSWRTSNKKYLCFVSGNAEWICGASN